MSSPERTTISPDNVSYILTFSGSTNPTPKKSIYEKERLLIQLQKMTAIKCHWCTGTGINTLFYSHSHGEIKDCMVCDGHGHVCGFCERGANACGCGGDNE